MIFSSRRAGRARWHGSAGRAVRVAGAVLLAIIALPYLIAPAYRFADPVSTLMLWRWATGQRVERIDIPLGRVSRNLAMAVIVAEDGRFCSHHGVDFRGLREVFADADDGENLRGGSTITQQVAKNLFLWPGRSYIRKALEFPLALWIDLVLPKRRILEIYLNVAEWGPDGEFGAEAASRRAFGQAASHLNARQAALLAATLPNPLARDARHPDHALNTLAAIYERRAARGRYLGYCVRMAPRPGKNP
jgi:monofunctional biosynthetic peptidoglycan transglycosylase